MDESDDTLLTVAHVAKLYSLKRATVYSAVSRHLIPAVILWRGKRRRVIRFRRTDIDQFLRDRTVRPR